MVSASYMIDRQPPPSSAKQLFDQRVIPAAINAFGGMEWALDRVADRTRRRPRTAGLAALGFGYVAAALWRIARPTPSWR